MPAKPIPPDIRNAAQRIRDKANEIYEESADQGSTTHPMEIYRLRELAEVILAALSDHAETHDTKCSHLYGGWPDQSAIRLFIAQQLETDAAKGLDLPFPSRGDDPAVSDQQLDLAWADLNQTLLKAMAYWEYPDQLLEMLEEQGRRCAKHILDQAPEPQRRTMEEAAAHALMEQPTEQDAP